MLCYLDTEFTRFKRPALVSLALVTQAGQEFYAERTDFPLDACSDFVRTTVIPLLGRVPGAACTLPTLKARLRQWFASLPEPVTVIYDFEGDAACCRQRPWRGHCFLAPSRSADCSTTRCWSSPRSLEREI